MLHPKRGVKNPMGTIPPHYPKDEEGEKKMIESLDATSAMVGNYLADQYSESLEEEVRPDRCVLPRRHLEWLGVTSWPHGSRPIRPLRTGVGI